MATSVPARDVVLLRPNIPLVLIGTLLVIIYLCIFVWLIRSRAFFECPGLSRATVSGLFLLKFGFGMLLYAVYAYHYAAERHYTDAFRYFDDAGVLFGSLSDSPSYFFQLLFGIAPDPEALKPYTDQMLFWDQPYSYGTFNDNRTMIRLNAVLYLFSFGHYHVHTAFWCFFSMIGLVGIYKSFIQWVPRLKWLLVAAIFLVPSVLFWGSSVLKEGLLLGGLGLFVYHFMRVVQVFSWKRLALLVGLFAFLVMIKTYILMALAPGLISYALVARLGTKKPLAVYAAVHVGLVTLAMNIHYLIPKYNIVRYIALKQRDFINTSEKHMPGSYFEVGRIEQSASSILANSPEALFNGLLRPLPTDVNSMLTAVASAENLCIALVLIVLLIFMRPLKNIPANATLFCASFSLVLLTLIGLVTPVAGALVRYKIPAVPFLLIAALLAVNVDRLPGKWFKSEAT